MQETPRYHDALTFVPDNGRPDVISLKRCYDDTVINIEDYLDQTRVAYDDRHEIWPGKSWDHRKHGAAAFPWDGASDLETRTVEDKIQTLVARSMDAMHRSHIQAYPVESGDAVRAKLVSSFLKWMVTGYIEGFDRSLELGANYFFEKGLMVSYVGWDQRKVRRLQRLSMDQIAAQMPEVAELIENPDNDAMIAGGMVEMLGVTEKRAKKALKQLRATGSADVPASEDIDRPLVKACAPDSDVLFPAWCIDPARAPYAFYRDYLTPQEIWNRVEAEGWARDWAEHVIEHYLGLSTLELETENNQRRGSRLGRYQQKNSELVEVLWMYQRLIDEEDGAEGIYCTVFHPHFAEDTEKPTNGDMPQPYAKHELLPDFSEFPFVVTDLSAAEKRLYEVKTIPDLIRSAQHSRKVEMDSRIDRNSMATLPELKHLHGKPPHDRGPGRLLPYRTNPNEMQYMDPPQINPDSIAMDDHLMGLIDRLLGMDPEDPDATVKRSFYIRKFLQHQRKVLAKCYEMYKLYGPERLFFRVTGLPEQMEMVKIQDERLDISIDFDTLFTDPDNIEKMLGQLFQVVPYDQGGRINMDALITYAVAAISPVLATQIIQTGEEGARDLLDQFTMDWAKMQSGVRVDAPPNGAGVILPALQSLQAEPDVVAGLQQNEAWADRVQNYVQQLQFQVQQTQNAETGRRGAPAAPISLNDAPYPNGSPAPAGNR